MAHWPAPSAATPSTGPTARAASAIGSNPAARGRESSPVGGRYVGLPFRGHAPALRGDPVRRRQPTELCHPRAPRLHYKRRAAPGRAPRLPLGRSRHLEHPRRRMAPAPWRSSQACDWKHPSSHHRAASQPFDSALPYLIRVISLALPQGSARIFSSTGGESTGGNHVGSLERRRQPAPGPNHSVARAIRMKRSNRQKNSYVLLVQQSDWVPAPAGAAFREIRHDSPPVDSPPVLLKILADP